MFSHWLASLFIIYCRFFSKCPMPWNMKRFQMEMLCQLLVSSWIVWYVDTKTFIKWSVNNEQWWNFRDYSTDWQWNEIMLNRIQQKMILQHCNAILFNFHHNIFVQKWKIENWKLYNCTFRIFNCQKKTEFKNPVFFHREECNSNNNGESRCMQLLFKYYKLECSMLEIDTRVSQFVREQFKF